MKTENMIERRGFLKLISAVLVAPALAFEPSKIAKRAGFANRYPYVSLHTKVQNRFGADGRTYRTVAVRAEYNEQITAEEQEETLRMLQALQDAQSCPGFIVNQITVQVDADGRTMVAAILLIEAAAPLPCGTGKCNTRATVGVPPTGPEPPPAPNLEFATPEQMMADAEADAARIAAGNNGVDLPQ